MKSALVATLFLNLILAYALGDQNANVRQLIAERDHMLAQRLSVLEVEQFIASRQPKRNAVERRGSAELIVDAANEFGKPPLMVARVALAESSLDHSAIGDNGHSIGVMQIQARYWVQEIPFVDSAKDLRDPQTNIRAGAWILRHYADTCGAEPEVYLACYNGGKKPNAQARAYARRVAGGV